MVFGPPKLKNTPIKELGNHFPSVSSQIRKLVILDSELCLSKQINFVVKNSFYQFSKLKSILSFP